MRLFNGNPRTILRGNPKKKQQLGQLLFGSGILKMKKGVERISSCLVLGVFFWVSYTSFWSRACQIRWTGTRAKPAIWIPSLVSWESCWNHSSTHGSIPIAREESVLRQSETGSNQDSYETSRWTTHVQTGAWQAWNWARWISGW